MIKKIINVFFKLPFIIFIIILTGVIAWETMDLFYKDKEANELKAQIDYEIYGNGEDRYYKLNDKLLEYFHEIMDVYRVKGIDGVSAYCNVRANEYGYQFFDFVLADGNIVYDSTTGSTVCENFTQSSKVAVKQYNSAPTELRLMVDGDLCKCTKYGWYVFDLYDYFDSATIGFIRGKAPELFVRLCATDDAVHYFYRDIEKEADAKKSEIDEQLENDVYYARDCIFSFAIAYVMLWILEICRQRRKVHESEKAGRIEKIKIEVMLVFSVASAIVFGLSILSYSKGLSFVSLEDLKLVQMVTTAAIVASATVLYGMIIILTKKICRGTVLKDSLIISFIIKIKNIIQETYGIDKYGSTEDIKKLYIRKVWIDVIVTVIVAYVAVNCVYFSDTKVLILASILVLFYIFYIYHSVKEYKYIRLFDKVNKNIDYLYMGMYEMVENDNDEEIIDKLSNLSKGFEKSVAKQIEAEKLQIELITNVSHDLKTPLTSVISYVDLLSKEELSPVASDYVKILVDKSDRLRTIVADVFDLAKATSGEEIELESLDGIILVNQVLSDMDDAIKESGRDVKLKIDVEAAPITANGQKLYRVFQNVIGNALKYSMPGTRIFINTYMEGKEFVFTIKNVSEFEMDFSEEEVLSRFVRGDKARHSEGNGLGLSIAKSFTEQCGGQFAVEIDDDIFKVIIRLK